MTTTATSPAPPDPRGRYAVARAVFLRCLGAVHLAAFVSYRVQVDGLVGSRGILPAARTLDSLRDGLGGARWLDVPTLCWFGAGDGALHGMCAAGVVLALLLIVGVAPRACLVLLWALYLSLVKAGGVFYWFQWDTLLLETTLAAVFLAPATLRPRLVAAGDPPRLALWLVRWVLFRLMFESGVVKLTAGDPCWQFDDLTALTYHYWTQPLPPWTAWTVNALPVGFHVASAAGMYVVELVAPFAMFLPRLGRLAGAAALAGLQVVLLVTGNYGFFNLLSLVLCIPLVDDGVWLTVRGLVRRRVLRRGTSGGDAPSPSGAPPDVLPDVPQQRTTRVWRAATIAFAALVAWVTSGQLCGAFRALPAWRGVTVGVERRIAPFESVNGYGLFRVMTKERREIVVEGSDDGTTWKAYEFRWKPGDVTRRPAFTTPHMPRLDWQMWFAALGPPEQSPWLDGLFDGLLAGSPPVLALLDRNPFPGRPPRYVRSLFYDYRFADAQERAATGAWWHRELLGLYTEPRTR